ncbi:hypothetical protein [Paludibacterium denitrificans]|uniref:LexA regulated protein n=1 Tax=Paludibacterium denitrificans TaxID=2675226 RepID=A0A844GI44_9NEIS|nr:hypothetical protein [Paludibacterium denitrificans]MTD34155.1 hypothetical protein [Paludibacterium denitrificans]HJV06423.1 hypothetical protein [Chromobacteriaceae bacterium]
MKRTDLAKNLGLKINAKLAQSVVPERFSNGAGELLDKKEQRKRDQALGLVPFATKLHIDLVKQLNELAQQRGVAVAVLVDELLRKSLND